jgi:hypothetical protein
MNVQVPGPSPWIECPWPRGKYQMSPGTEIENLGLVVWVDRGDAAASLDHIGHSAALACQ